MNPTTRRPLSPSRARVARALAAPSALGLVVAWGLMAPAARASDASGEPRILPDPVPIIEPPPEAAGEAEQPAASKATGEEQDDRLKYPNYLPGYASFSGVGESPYMPSVGALPGGLTPGYGTPMPATKDWTFRWAGFMSASLQFSIDQRRDAIDDQRETVLHAPPQTVDNYASFLSSATVPGNWVSMRFSYGNRSVDATVSIETWNPTRPSTYYGLGSQYFINNAYMTYRADDIGDLRLRFQLGRFALSYGGLSRYGGGVYVNPISGNPSGVGELTVAEYDLTDDLELVAKHGIMGARDGLVPSNVVPSPTVGWRRPAWPATWTHHAHLGLRLKGTPELRVQAHYSTTWSQEDRNDAEFDNPGTRQIDESDMRDGRLTIYGVDATLAHDGYGFLGAGASYTTGRDVYPLKGMMAYGGDGEYLTDRWWGVTTGGTGKLLVAAINYSASVGKIINYPNTFGGNGPDIVINTGLHWTKTWTEFEPYDGRARYKYALDGLYTFHRYVGVGLRGDRIIPSSRDDGETFHVLAGRLQFKTDWNSHEQLVLMYARWFYGDRTRNEGTGERSPDRLDDQLVALNFNMWW